MNTTPPPNALAARTLVEVAEMLLWYVRTGANNSVVRLLAYHIERRVRPQRKSKKPGARHAR
ncbi:MAG: hypothetical protein FJ304_15080 [Planctomycetes bacterium]|nr:hypothetical protein [Planctomycetota bacterium]